MSKRRKSLKAIVRAIDQTPDRSSLFWWLFDIHDEILSRKRGKRIIWAPIAAEAAALGLTDRDNKPASPEVARLTWYRVRQEVARRRALEPVAVMPARHQPSRAPANWQPPVARSPPEARPAHAGPAAASVPSRPPQSSPAPGVASEESSFDRAFRRLAERSGL